MNDIHNDLLFEILEYEFDIIDNNSDKLKSVFYTERLNGFNVFYS